jgi:adenylate kinase
MAKAPSRYPAALIFGAPGAGKGTQGEILTRVPGFFHLSTGVIFRKLDPQMEEARQISESFATGWKDGEPPTSSGPKNTCCCSMGFREP